MPSPEEYYREKIPAAELAKIMEDCRARGVSCHNALMDRVGWPAIPYDGQLLVSHQDALLMGGKVQAPPGYADHVRFIYPDFCERCVSQNVHRDVLRPGDHGAAPAACRCSIAKSASTAARASGTAACSWARTRRAATSRSARAPADCTPPRISLPLRLAIQRRGAENAEEAQR